MVGISYSRALLTFAFVKQEFEQTGDLLRGFMPLFAPIFSSLGESIFDPREFTSKVESFYGLRMHPYVAEDWIPRFEDAGFIELIEGDRFNKTYRCRSRETTSMMQDASLITEVVNELVEHTDSLLRAHNFELDRTRIEEAIISRLCKPEFINILNRPQRNPINPNRLTLSKGKEEEALRHEDALIDFILADRLLHLFEHNKEHFAQVADVARGALVSEVVLGLRSPPKLGQSAKGTEVFLDSPIIIDLLDLSERLRSG